MENRILLDWLEGGFLNRDDTGGVDLGRTRSSAVSVVSEWSVKSFLQAIGLSSTK